MNKLSGLMLWVLLLGAPLGCGSNADSKHDDGGATATNGGNGSTSSTGKPSDNTGEQSNTGEADASSTNGQVEAGTEPVSQIGDPNNAPVSKVPECAEIGWPLLSRKCWNCQCEPCPAEVAACGQPCFDALDCGETNKCWGLETAADEVVCLFSYCRDHKDVFPKLMDWYDKCLYVGNDARDRCDEACK